MANLATGIIWAADQGADVANFSLQYYSNNAPDFSTATVEALQNAINYATEQGMLMIAATGNNNAGGVDRVAHPARLRNVIAVGGTDASDRRAVPLNVSWTSNAGPPIDVSAPGDDIYSTDVSCVDLHLSALRV